MKKNKPQLNWAAAEIDWHRTNAEIAQDLGLSRQAVAAARKRHAAPASPAGHGGARRGGLVTHTSAQAEIAALAKSLTAAQAAKVISYIRELTALTPRT